MLRPTLLAAAAFPVLVGCGPLAAPGTETPGSSGKTGTCAILSVNDTYRIEPSPEGEGGMARVRYLRAKLEKQYPDLLLLHAGDFLFPSLLSRQLLGVQMIDVMNRLDGSDALDPRLIVTLGNHEFDDDRPATLSGRLGEAAFRLVSSNIEFARKEGVSLVDTDKLAKDVVIGCGGFRVGVFGLTTDEKTSPYVALYEDPIESARARSKDLRARGADVVVGLTHLEIDVDEQLLRTLGDAGPDLIVGGHEHARQTRSVGNRGIYKADADGHTANLLKVTMGPSGVHAEHEWISLLPDTVPEDPEMKAVVDGWLQKHETAYCTQRLHKPFGCLEEKLTVATTDLVAEELAIRLYETNLGDYVADRALEAFAKDGAQIAFLNAGTLRLNDNIAKKTPVTLRRIEELFAYPAPLRLIEISGATLQKVVDHAIVGWTGAGHWLQIAGFAFRHDPKAHKATDLTLLGPTPRRILPTDKIRAAVVSFLVDPSKGQDGYTMIGPNDIVDKLASDAAAPDLKQLVVEAFRKAGSAGVGPVFEGRICTTTQPELPCLVK